MLRVLHMPYWKPAADLGKPWVLSVDARTMRAFATREQAETAARKLADVTGATLKPTRC